MVHGHPASIPFRIPYGEGSEREIMLRAELVTHFELVPVRAFWEIIQNPSELLSKPVRAKLLRWAKSDLLEINEYDRTELLHSYYLTPGRTIDGVPAAEGLRQSMNSPAFREIRKMVGGKTDDYMEIYEALVKYAWGRISNRVLSRVRAKLAYLELAAAFTGSPDLMFRLLTITPRYLSCPVVQERVHAAIYRVRHEKGVLKQRGERFMTRLNKSLIGDRRRKPRKYDYWWLAIYHEMLTICLTAYREASGDVAKEAHREQLAQVFNVSPLQLKRVDDPKTKLHMLAREIMEDNEMIKDVRFFNDVIRPKIRRIKKQHLYSDDDPMIIALTIGSSTIYPEHFDRVDVWEQVEQVRISLK